MELSTDDLLNAIDALHFRATDFRKRAETQRVLRKNELMDEGQRYADLAARLEAELKARAGG